MHHLLLTVHRQLKGTININSYFGLSTVSTTEPATAAPTTTQPTGKMDGKLILWIFYLIISYGLTLKLKLKEVIENTLLIECILTLFGLGRGGGGGLLMPAPTLNSSQTI